MPTHEECGPLPDTALSLPYHPSTPIVVDYGITVGTTIAGRLFRLKATDPWMHQGARVIGYRLLTQDELNEDLVPASQR